MRVLITAASGSEEFKGCPLSTSASMVLQPEGEPASMRVCDAGMRRWRKRTNNYALAPAA